MEAARKAMAEISDLASSDEAEGNDAEAAVEAG